MICPNDIFKNLSIVLNSTFSCNIVVNNTYNCSVKSRFSDFVVDSNALSSSTCEADIVIDNIYKGKMFISKNTDLSGLNNLFGSIAFLDDDNCIKSLINICDCEIVRV